MLGEFYDPNRDVRIDTGDRPHWSQSSTITFITFRTVDSIPKSVVLRWDKEKEDWLSRRGYNALPNWQTALARLEQTLRDEFNKHFNRTREIFLDKCHGNCHLRRPDLAKIVADSLMHFDGDRYRMGDFVVMPNHVHLMASFATNDAMRSQCMSWLHYTAVQINRKLGCKGRFWQQEPFDHLVRSFEQYEYLRRYIAENPAKAKLRDGEFLYRRLAD